MSYLLTIKKYLIVVTQFIIIYNKLLMKTLYLIMKIRQNIKKWFFCKIYLFSDTLNFKECYGG